MRNIQGDFDGDIDAIDSWVGPKLMELAIDKCLTLKRGGTHKEFHLSEKRLKTVSENKDFGITLSKNLSWEAHIKNRLNKANRAFYSIGRNLAYKVKAFNEVGFYKSSILPILLLELDCLKLPKSDPQNLEKFQRKTSKWITGPMKTTRAGCRS